MILILTAGFGDGHNTAARSVAEALRRDHPEEMILVSDLITEIHPTLAAILKELYQIAITNLPSAWRLLYQLLGKSAVAKQGTGFLAPLIRGLQECLDRHQPRLIISTYPLYAGLLERLASKGPVPPLATIITDSITVHPIWVASTSDLLCVADEPTKRVVEGFGMPSERVLTTGFPVNPAFAEPLAPRSPGAKKSLLYLPSTSTRRVSATLEALIPQLADGLQLTLPVGKHASRLHHPVQRLLDQLPSAQIEILGWTDRMPELLRTHDVVICKAGGAIVHEVLAAQIPAVIDYVVPGQEEGNAELLLNHGCALQTHSARETARAVESILADNARLGREMRQRMRPLSMPDAAAVTGRTILQALNLK